MENTNINNDIKIPNKSYFYGDKFSFWANEIESYALDIAIENHFSQLLDLPLDRIIYASNDYCFRERTRKNEGNLNLPFMNYYRVGYSETDRFLWNNYANLRGLLDVTGQNYERETGSKIKIAPVRVEYEMSIFFSQQKDCEYCYKLLAFDESNETLLYPTMKINENYDLKNIAIQSMNLEFNPTYNESDWLINNKIYSITIDPQFDTFQIMADTEFDLAEEIVFNFISAKNLVKPNVLDSSPKEILFEYFGKK